MNKNDLTILAVDTGTEIFQAVLTAPSGTWEIEKRSGLRHAEQIATVTQELLERIPLSDIDAVTYARGPGSFTGLRIEAAFCKGLCAVGESPRLISIPTLPAMAAAFRLQYPAETAERFLLPCIDGRKQRFYLQLFAPDGTPCSDPEDADAERFTELLNISGILPGEITVLGPHAELFREFCGLSDMRTAFPSGCARGLIQLARTAFMEGRRDAADQGPEYFRVSQAEEKG